MGGPAATDDELEARYARLLDLEPVYRQSFERHVESADRGAWTYTDYLPAIGGQMNPLSEQARMAVEIALLTEVNLPWYTSYLASHLPAAPSLRRFLHVWTAEEDQHALLLESYLLLTASGNAEERSALRRATVRTGFTPVFAGPFPMIVYAALQELQTRAFYLRSAAAVGAESPLLAHAFRRLSKDETLHAAFYRDVVAAHLEADPDYILIAAKSIEHFQMPGYVQPGYRERSAFATRHLFNANHFVEDVLEYAWACWRLDELEPRGSAARAALQRLGRWRRAFRRLAERQRTASEGAAT